MPPPPTQKKIWGKKKRKGWKNKKCFLLIVKTQGHRSPESVVTNRPGTKNTDVSLHIPTTTKHQHEGVCLQGGAVVVDA